MAIARGGRERRGLRQTAYRVLVAADDAALQEERGAMWDSGKVAAEPEHGHSIRRTGIAVAHQVLVEGPALGSGRAAERLEPAREFHARDCWPTAIGRRSGSPHLRGQLQSALPVFRHQFRLAKPVRHAVLFICGLGHYELHLNGQRVGDCVMDPGWTNYRRTCLYNGYDVTERLQVGDNAIGVMLGNGMYNVTGGRYVKFTGSFGPPKLICQLHVTFADGTTQTWPRIRTWRTAAGPIMFSCIYGGEDYDAQREQPGWDTRVL